MRRCDVLFAALFLSFLRSEPLLLTVRLPQGEALLEAQQAQLTLEMEQRKHQAETERLAATASSEAAQALRRTFLSVRNARERVRETPRKPRTEREKPPTPPRTHRTDAAPPAPPSPSRLYGVVSPRRMRQHEAASKLQAVERGRAVRAQQPLARAGRRRRRRGIAAAQRAGGAQHH